VNKINSRKTSGGFPKFPTYVPHITLDSVSYSEIRTYRLTATMIS